MDGVVVFGNGGVPLTHVGGKGPDGVEDGRCGGGGLKLTNGFDAVRREAEREGVTEGKW